MRLPVQGYNNYAFTGTIILNTLFCSDDDVGVRSSYSTCNVVKYYYSESSQGGQNSILNINSNRQEMPIQ